MEGKNEEIKEEKEIKNETKKGEKNKSHVVLITLLMVLLLIAFFGFGYALGGTNIINEIKNNNSETKEEDKKDEEKEIKLTEQEVSEKLTNLESFGEYFSSKYPMKVSEISNQDMLFFIMRDLGSNPTAETVSKKIERIFGKDYDYKLEDIECFLGDGVLYKYDSAAKKYSSSDSHPGHGGKGIIDLKIYFQDAIQKGDTLTINTKIIYGGGPNGVRGPLTNLYSEYPFDNPIYEIKDEDKPEEESYNDAYENLKDELPITQFIYKKQSDNNYGLTEIKINK